MLELEKMFQTIRPDETLGLVGVGTFGSKLKRIAEETYRLKTLLCDPPRSRNDAEELNDAIHVDWGNGMGGCDFSRLETETFVPLSEIRKYADVIAVQVPLNSETRGMIDPEFLDECRKDVAVWVFSDSEVVSPDARTDGRIRFVNG